MKKWTKIIGALSLLAAIAFPAGSAQANTAAGVSITNTATLTYNGTTTTSSVIVSVALKPSNPNITISGGTATYNGVNTPGINQMAVITATANGPTDYTVSVAAGTQGNNNSSGGSANAVTPYSASAPTSVNVPQLGATVTTGTSGTTYVTVPATAGAVNGSSINGITLGAHILIINGSNSNQHEVTVTGIVLQADGTYQIQWSGAIPAGDVPGAGVVIGERRVLNNFYAYPGTVQNAGSDITVAVNATAINNGLTITTSTPAANSWTTTAPTVQFIKFVRNVSNAITGNGGSDTFGGATYYRNNVTAKPGEILEYLIEATNTDTNNTGNPLTGCIISDALPTASYATFVTGAYGANKDITYSDTAGTVGFLQTSSSAPHQATLIGQNLSVNVGDTASDTQAGNVPAHKTVKILYQLTIN